MTIINNFNNINNGHNKQHQQQQKLCVRVCWVGTWKCTYVEMCHHLSVMFTKIIGVLKLWALWRSFFLLKSYC